MLLLKGNKKILRLIHFRPLPGNVLRDTTLYPCHKDVALIGLNKDCAPEMSMGVDELNVCRYKAQFSLKFGSGDETVNHMYIPHQYKNENLAEVMAFIRANSFGILVNQFDGKPWATHIPLELEQDTDGRHYLVGHISRANPQWEAFGENQAVLCIFNGPHAYVSSSWYKEEEVPTWDYIAVHIYGTLSVLDDRQLYASLERLVARYESHSKHPVTLAGLSAKTLRQIRGVVGFKIAVEDIQAAYKLSQGRPQDHETIIRELEAGGDPGAVSVARAIRDQGKTSPK